MISGGRQILKENHLRKIVGSIYVESNNYIGVINPYSSSKTNQGFSRTTGQIILK